MCFDDFLRKVSKPLKIYRESAGVNCSELGATAGGRTLVLLTGAAKINDFMSKLAFRSRFARSGAHFYAQARWFRTLCTGAGVLQNCAKPSRLCTKIARLQNRQKLMRKRQVSTGIGALLARFGRYFSKNDEIDENLRYRLKLLKTRGFTLGFA